MSTSPRFRALFQALLVTFLWSTSWVLIKITLDEIPPLIFAGLRYTLAFLVLLPGLWKHRAVIRALTLRDWRRLGVLGLVFYTFTQGGQFVTLEYLEAVTFSLILSFTPVLVAIFGIFTLGEWPTRRQWAGILIFLAGVLAYFFPLDGPGGPALGFLLAALTLGANAAASVLGRSTNRGRESPPLVVTAVSMGIGAFVLMGAGLALQGLPAISPRGWLVVLWLAVINTALAFTLWNASLQEISAAESSVINNTMLVQIAVLAWLFLGEQITLREGVGLALAAIGILITVSESDQNRLRRSQVTD